MDDNSTNFVNQEIYEEFLNCSIALFKQIKAKSLIETETITQEEADFANAFIVYVKELNEVIDNQSE